MGPGEEEAGEGEEEEAGEVEAARLPQLEAREEALQQ